MADLGDPRREDYCAHAEWTMGCIACDYIDTWEYRIDGLAEHQKWSEAVKQAEEFLGSEGLSDDQKQRYTHQLETAREYKQACEDNLLALDEDVDSRKAEVDAVCSKHPQESWPQAFQDLVGPKVEELYAPLRRAYPNDPQIGMFVREGQSTEEVQTQGSDEAGVKEAQGSSSATAVDSSWQAVIDSLRQQPGFESEDVKQRHAMIQKKLEDLVLDLDDKKLGFDSPLDYYDGEPILLTTLKELEKEKEAQKEQ
ncbi:hypothetical protein KC318_g539 [Hortaea werneckii]|uniref:Uncharacterized protein n=1 Tax=Hortaea werneckii TaxID=91943 RepID=A0A3M7BP67_HORWE|nr:hypothetical protein KC334_g1290 [Hortaea werneckii]KAI6970232.1 hypothetical protein KC355_g11849 [Hortaea werneckii]KAI7676019.1 hypothetical protein KC318_g539 [Hortaea werneckii]RMY25795.1 hypothetical protein D0867_00481 [Hortaea werneckii]RMY41608.1 hypothetical protein D0866_00484 [Hortaea werneckii]